MLKIEITEKGVHNEQNEELPVGTLLDINDVLPNWLVNKCRVVSNDDGLELVSNDPQDKTLEELRAEYRDLSGKEAPSDADEQFVQELIDAERTDLKNKPL